MPHTPHKRTKIVCTIGPATDTTEKITNLLRSGMNVARLNFSHGTHEEHAKLVKRLRKASTDLDRPIAILQDLQGPKIRVGELPKEGVKLTPGKQIIFTTGKPDIAKMKLPVTYKRLHLDVKKGEKLLLDDGLLSATVDRVRGKEITCTVVDGGMLTSHKGMNFPHTKLSVAAITDKDRDDARFGVIQHVDWVALSFVRTAKEIRALRRLIQAAQDELDVMHKHAYPIRIIAKIEKPDAVKNIDEIIKAADGIMVARGDLGIEMPAEEVPLIQKMLIEKCLAAAKPVIVATQMLDSMIRNPRPTRAEVSDVANAVIDHTDAVMLSGETAAGKYPIETVRTMAKIVQETEASTYDDLLPHTDGSERTTDEGITDVASILAQGVRAKLILVASLSGNAARLVSRHRPQLEIYAATNDKRVERQMALSWGVRPFLLPRAASLDALVKHSVRVLQTKRVLKKGDKIIVVAGDPVGVSGRVNLVEVREVT